MHPSGANPEHFEQSVLQMPHALLGGNDAVHLQNQESWLNHLIIELACYAAAYAGDDGVLAELQPGKPPPPSPM